MQDRDEYFKGISFVKVAFLALFFLGMMVLVGQVRGGEWNEKPVMCDKIKVVQNLVRDKGEVLIMSGIQLTKVRDPSEPNGLSPTPATLPLRLYVNLQTKTFTIIETHPSYAVSCILAFGEEFNSILLDVL